MSQGLRVFLIYKSVVLLFAFVALGAVSHIFPISIEHFISLLFEWDAKHILNVAANGYSSSSPTIQVLPVFPLLIRGVHFIIWNWTYAAFVAAQTCSFFAFSGLYKLARLELTEDEAHTALFLFAVFPTAYFLTAPYAESAFCALSFYFVYHLRKQNYGLAALLGLLTVLCRMTGILFAPALVLHWLFSRKSLDRANHYGFGVVLAALVAGFGIYLGMNKWLFHDSTYFMANQVANWGVHLSYPFSGAIVAIKSWSTRSAEQKISIIILELAFTLIALGLLPWVWRRLKKLDFFYMFLTLLLLTSMDFWLSRPRYVLPLYPMFIATAPWFNRSHLRIAVYALISIGLFAIYWALYLNAQWAH